MIMDSRSQSKFYRNFKLCIRERECPGRLDTVDRKAEAPSPVAEMILMAVLGGTIESRLVNLASLSSRCRLF